MASDNAVASKRVQSTPKRALRNPMKQRQIKLSEQVKLFQTKISELSSIIAEYKERERLLPSTTNAALDFTTPVTSFDFDAYKLKFPSTITVCVEIGAVKCIYRVFRDMPFDSILSDVARTRQLSQFALYAGNETRVLIPENMRCSRLTEIFSTDNESSDATVFIRRV